MSEVADAPEVTLRTNLSTSDDEPSGPVSSSLEARIAARRTDLNEQTTELFDVPGFADIFRVELKRLTLKRVQQIADQTKRIHAEDQRNLRIAADTILAATVQFHGVDDDGSASPQPEVTWVTAAKAFDPTLGDSLHPRVALIRLVGDMQLALLAGDYMEWLRSGTPKVERELERDFQGTP